MSCDIYMHYTIANDTMHHCVDQQGALLAAYLLIQIWCALPLRTLIYNPTCILRHLFVICGFTANSAETDPAYRYYSMLFLADLVADIKSPRVYRVGHLDTYDLAHYVICDGSKLQKMVLLNIHYHNGSTETRPLKAINVAPVLGRDIEIKRLTAPNTIAKTGVTWKRQAGDAAGKILGTQDVEGRSDGVVTLFASEAVIVQGSRQVPTRHRSRVVTDQD